MSKRAAPSRERPAKPASKALDRAAILGADDIVTRRVRVPEWGGHVFVRSMTAGERDAFDAFVTSHADEPRVRAYIVALCAVDADGNRLFSADDVDALNAKCSAAMTEVFMAAREINKLFLDDSEDQEKN